MCITVIMSENSDFADKGKGNGHKKRTFRQNYIYFVFFDTFVAVFHVYNAKMNKNWAKVMILHIVPAVSLVKKHIFAINGIYLIFFSLSYCFSCV